MADETEMMNIRIPKRLKRQVARAAQKDDRSITSFVIRALQTALEHANGGAT